MGRTALIQQDATGAGRGARDRYTGNEMPYLRSFAAGFLATLLFHQVLLGILHAAGAVPFAPFNFAPTAPLGVPQVLSLAFWGGLWGIVLWALLHRAHGVHRWLWAIAIGAVAPTAVAVVVVFPLKGIPVHEATILLGLLLNGAWGLGTEVFLRVLPRRVIAR